MSDKNTFREWKAGRVFPPDAPVIPDHAFGYPDEVMLDIWGPHERVCAYGRQWVWNTFPGKAFQPELLEQLYAAIALDGDKIKAITPRQRPDILIEKLIRLDRDHTIPVSEQYQMLGYVIGVLAANGVIEVDRDMNLHNETNKGA